MDIMEYIGEGRSAAVTRKELCSRTGLSDRHIRGLIEAAKEKYPIINVGEGYFLPTEEDSALLTHYINEEYAKAMKIIKGLKRHRIKEKELWIR